MKQNPSPLQREDLLEILETTTHAQLRALRLLRRPAPERSQTSPPPKSSMALVQASLSQADQPLHIEEIIAPLFAQAVADPTLASAPRVYTGTDDPLLRKTGQKIPGTTYARDPLSPPFQVNLVLGQRFVQTSLLIQPAGSEHPWRALPVSFSPAPTPKIPKRGSAEQQTAVKEFPAGYRLRKGSQLRYREPAFLITTDLTTPAAELIAAYLARWEVEVNFRDEKTLLGVGQAQVRSPQSVARAPAFLAACYALLLWSNIRVFGDHRTDAFKKLPRWRHAEPVRPSTRDLLRLLQQQAQDYQPRQAPIIPN